MIGAMIAGVVMSGLPLLTASGAPPTREHEAIAPIVAREIAALLPENAAGGVAVAVRHGGQTHFFNYGFADSAAGRPLSEDSLFNLASLRKVFEAALLAQAVQQGALRLDDPVTDYVPELRGGGDITKVTLGELATHTSGLLLPQDHPPWPTEHYTLAGFLDRLKAWKADADRPPGARHMYTHAGYVLLQLALERGLGQPIGTLIAERITGPLHLASTVLPERGADAAHGGLAPALRARAAQGYDENGAPVGTPGDQQGYYDFPGTGQMFSSARDLATFLAANMGEEPATPALRAALQFAQQSRVPITPQVGQALAWEVHADAAPPIVGKNGGLNNTSTYIGMMPEQKTGVVILVNRGDQDPASAGRRILRDLHERGLCTRPGC
jgi:beta-lactamase class C